MPLLTRPPSASAPLAGSVRAHSGLIAPISCLLTWHLPAHVHAGLHPGLFAPRMAAVLRLTLPPLPRLDGRVTATMNVNENPAGISNVSHLNKLARSHPSLAAKARVVELGSGGDQLVFQRGSDLLVGLNPTLRMLTSVFALPGFCATEILAGSDAQVTLEPGAARLHLMPRSWTVIQLYPRCG